MNLEYQRLAIRLRIAGLQADVSEANLSGNIGSFIP